MSANDPSTLLYSDKIMTTGVIVSQKPWYDIKNGKKKRIGYLLSIKTPHTIKRGSEEIPIYISTFGRTQSWHSYFLLIKTQEPVSINGTKRNWKLYDDKKHGGRALWIFLERDPPPKMIYLGTKALEILNFTRPKS